MVITCLWVVLLPQVSIATQVYTTFDTFPPSTSLFSELVTIVLLQPSVAVIEACIGILSPSCRVISLGRSPIKTGGIVSSTLIYCSKDNDVLHSSIKEYVLFSV